MRTTFRVTSLLALTVSPLLAAATAAQCTDMLRKALEAHNPETRVQAVVALSLAPERGPMIPLLEGMLHDKDVQVRLAVVASLAELKTKAATEALLQLLDDDVPEVSFAAAKVLWSRHDPAGKQALIAVLQGESKTSSGFFSKQKRDALRMMHTPRTTFLYALREGVGFAPVPGLGEGIASMQAILTDSGVSGRATAALLLGKDKDASTLEGLKDALHDKDWHVRAAAVHSLSLGNDPRLKPDIEALLEDDKEEVRLRAAAGCLRLLAVQAGRKPPAKK